MSLGDSLSVGYEPGKQRYYGFTHRLFEQALLYGRVEFKNYGINGLTSSGMRTLLESVMADKQVLSTNIQKNFSDGRADTLLSQIGQVKKDLQQAKLITITIGGNDFISLLSDVQSASEEELSRTIEQRLNTYTYFPPNTKPTKSSSGDCNC